MWPPHQLPETAASKNNPKEKAPNEARARAGSLHLQGAETRSMCEDPTVRAGRQRSALPLRTASRKVHRVRSRRRRSRRRRSRPHRAPSMASTTSTHQNNC